MKTLTFSVSVTFNDKVTDDNEIAEVGNNILNALVREARNYGISPEDSDTCANTIKVSIDEWQNEEKV